MDIPTLTKRIAVLPRDVRHIIASSLAVELSRRKGADLAEMWEISRDHDVLHRWPSAQEIRDGFIRCGVPATIYRKLVARYDDYAAEPKQFAARHDKIEERWGEKAVDTSSVDYSGPESPFKYCPPPEVL